MTSELALATIETFKNQVIHADLLTLCASIPRASIDMILCDLPYGTTACSWDEIIPLEPMWAQFKRVIKPRGAIVLTASQPFTSKLVSSNYEMFRYEWIWQKTNVSGFLNANKAPLKDHENILIFYQQNIYYPQFEKGKAYTANRLGSVSLYGGQKRTHTVNKSTRHPKTVLKFSSERGLHPTQKPVALFEYLIRTYTQAGDVVLDPCVGSGTTAIAARQTGRHFICGDRELEYVNVARERLAKPYTQPMFAA